MVFFGYNWFGRVEMHANLRCIINCTENSEKEKKWG